MAAHKTEPVRQGSSHAADATRPVPDLNRGKPRFRTSNTDRDIRRTGDGDPNKWRSSARTSGGKKDYLDSPTKTSAALAPRRGSALRAWQQLDAEGRRREDLARERLARELGVNKLYALERERERLRQIRIDKRDELEQQKIAKSIRNVMPYRSDRVADSVASGDRDKARWKRGERDREAGKGVSGGMRTRGEKKVAGRVNRGTVPEADQSRHEILPVVRGGVPRSAMGKQRRRNRPKVLKKVTLPSTIRLENLTRVLGVKLFHLQRAMERIGLTDSRPERLLTAEDASLIALEFDFDPSIDDEAAFDLYPAPPPDDPTVLIDRPPVTGIFGHVDHGKTSLLDALRSTSVAAGEAGGITQHIGAFEVSIDTIVANLKAKSGDGSAAAKQASTGSTSATITFLDTPGHAAFAAMRERGTQVTDVVVLVVAADDGVKPQTQEVIDLIKQSDVGVVVALTKCDKPGLDIVKVKQEIMAAGIEIEDFGGDVPCVEVSSMTGQGLPELLETISTIAEVRELKAERGGRSEGRVLESRVEKGRGNVATVLVTRGCMRPTTNLAAGTTWCRIRSLTAASGATVQEAFPGQPVEVTGWKDLPSAGDLVLEAANEDDAKKAVTNRLRRLEQQKMWEDVEVINEKRRLESELEAVRKEEERSARAKGLRASEVAAAGEAAVEQLQAGASSAEVKELLLIIKADVSGTVEAVTGALEGIGNKEAKVKIIHSGVGDVQESDVEMARAVGASVIGFNVKAPKSVLSSASRPPNPVKIYTSAIIYRLVEQIRQSVADLLPKDIDIRVHGEALVQQLFDISYKAASGKKESRTIAGCKVSNGTFQKARKARVIRKGETVFAGTVSTLKQVKKDVLEIPKGVECGIALEGFDGFQVDDAIQSIEEVEVARSL
ncbi:translation initiation factor IF-2 [Microbotryomycetes sp. JL201]|nr:translation initiation factor IF-2 [Microbotryomycetes sp. JL201]